MYNTIRDYISLMKPRVMSLVIFTVFVGMYVAPVKLYPVYSIFVIFSIALGSGAAGVLNMWYDSDIDSIMSRTQNRAIVSGKVSKKHALIFGLVLTIISVALLTYFSNVTAGFLLLFTILFYAVIYTVFLKRYTTQNIVIGGIAGALPPLIGWTAATNEISVFPLILVMIIFLWTPAHFWALALFREKDYKAAKIPMLPIVYGGVYTKIMILLYVLLTVICSFLPFIVGMTGITYLISAIILGLWFLYYSCKLVLGKDITIAPKLFKVSIIYLFLLFVFIVFDRI
jgi:protoheme IX farnesyltransferase